MKFKLLFLIILFNLLLFNFAFAQTVSYNMVSDTWAQIEKFIIGNFDNWVWSDTPYYSIEGPDTDGKWLFNIQLPDNTEWEYKYGINISGDTKYEFSSHRSFTVIGDDSGNMYIEDNWGDTPLVPINIELNPSINQITLNWNHNSDYRNLDVVHGGYYNIFIDTGDNTWEKINPDTMPIIGNEYTILELENDVRYYFKLQSVDAYGLKSELSDSVSAVPAEPIEVSIIVDMGNIPDTLSIIGDFNDWDTTANYLSLLSDGSWGCTFLVSPYNNHYYKLFLNDEIYEEDAEYKFEFFHTTADYIHITGDMNGWNYTSYLLRKMEGTDTWVIWLPGINNGMEYKYRIDNDWEVYDGNRVVADAGGTNRILYVEESDTIYIDWSGRSNPPENIEAEAISDTAIKLNILPQASSSDSFDSHTWNIYRGDSEHFGYMLIASVSSQTTQFIDSGLLSGEKYYYRVTGVDSGISDEWMLEGNYSPAVSAVAAAPVFITFNLDAGKISDDYDSIVIGGSFNNWSDTVDKLEKLGNGKWTITKELAVGQTIEYKFNIEGTTWERNRLKRIEKEFSGANRVYIAGTFNGWDANATPMIREIGTDTWYIEIGLSNDDMYKFVIDNVWEPGDNRQVTDASPNRTYTAGLWSETILHNWNDNPEKPVITLNADASMIYVNWNAVDSDVFDTGYRLYRSVSSTDNFIQIDYGNQYYNYIDTNVETGETYYYKVIAIDSTDSELESSASDIKWIQPGYLGTAVFYIYAGENPFVEEISIVGDFNNWSRDANVLTLSDSPGLWVGSVNNVVINRSYNYKYLYNRGSNTWEPIEGNRYTPILEINEHNWGNHPRQPDISAVPEDGVINIYITTKDIDIRYYDLFRNGSFYQRINSTEFNTLFIDTNVSLTQEYTYYVESYDFGGLKSEASENVSATAGAKERVKFVVDMRPEIYRTGRSPRFGVQLAGSPAPLSVNPVANRLRELSNGVYEKELEFITHQNVNYFYAYDAGTSREVREIFEYTFTYYDPSASNVRIAGSFNDWDIAKSYVMIKDESGTWSFKTDLPAGVYSYKFIIDGNWESDPNRELNLYRNFEITLSETRYDVFGAFEDFIQPPKSIVAAAFGLDIRLDWMSNVEPGVDTYIIYRGIDTGNMVIIADTTGNYYLDTNVDSSQPLYYYYVKAQNSNDTSQPSEIAMVNPGSNPNSVRFNSSDKIFLQTDISNIIDKNIKNIQFMSKADIAYYSIYDDNYNNYLRMIENAKNKVLASNSVNFIENQNPDDYLTLIKFIDYAGNEVDNFDTTITITSFVDTDIINDLSILKMYVLDTEKESWQILEQSVIGSDTVAVTRYDNSIYIVLKSEAGLGDLSEMVVWPNPMYYHSSQSGVVTFDNLPNDVESIRIFTITGEEVIVFKNFDYDGNNKKAIWDCRNSSGNVVASGIYLYYVKSAAGVQTGRLGIIK